MISAEQSEADENEAEIGYVSPTDYYRLGRHGSLPDDIDAEGNHSNNNNNESNLSELMVELDQSDRDKSPTPGEKPDKTQRRRKRIIVRSPEMLQRLPQSLSFSEVRAV